MSLAPWTGEGLEYDVANHILNKARVDIQDMDPSSMNWNGVLAGGSLCGTRANTSSPLCSPQRGAPSVIQRLIPVRHQGPMLVE